MDHSEVHRATGLISNLAPGVGFYALEVREDFEKRDKWFFLHQSQIAAEHLTEVQHCDPESVEYAGTHRGWHVWLAHS
jgi:hypothetical protein